MKGRFMSGIIAGSVLGVTAGMYAITKMNPRQRRRMMKKSKKMLSHMMDNMDILS